MLENVLKEKEVENKARKFFQSKGWKVYKQVKIRGRIVDIVAVKNKEIALIEAKGDKGDVLKGIGQAIHQLNCANYSFLAVPPEKISEDTKKTANNLGIGLLSIGNTVKEICMPKRKEALPSVKQQVLRAEKVKPTRQKKNGHSWLYSLFPSETRINLLSLFLANPGKEFYVRELEKKTGRNINSVRKELNRLEKIGLVVAEVKGLHKYYSINKKHLIYEELKRIFLKTGGIGRLLKENLSRIGAIKYAFIYGSFAKGDETGKSDIDLFIVGEVDENELVKAVSRVEKRVCREINYVLFTPKEFAEKKKKKNPFIENVLKEPKIMLVGGE